MTGPQSRALSRIFFTDPARSSCSGSMICRIQNGDLGPNTATPAESGPRQDSASSMVNRVWPSGRLPVLSKKPMIPHIIVSASILFLILAVGRPKDYTQFLEYAKLGLHDSENSC